MIVKDEEKNLRGCLDSVKDLVDEIILVDTGSNDSSIAIGKWYGASICHFDWIDDFAAARNVSIRQATGSHILWLDADDRLEVNACRRLMELKMELPVIGHDAYALLVTCRNSLGDAAVYYQTRLFPNIDKIRFEGRVHESIDPSLSRLGIRTVRKEIEILHTGYDDSSGIRKKIERNLKILTAEHTVADRRPVDWFKIAQCQFGLRDYSSCLDSLNNAREMAQTHPLYKSSYTMMADCLFQLGRSGEAITLLDKAIGEFPGSGYIAYLMGAAQTLSGRFESALKHLSGARRFGIEIEGHPVLQNIESRIRYYEGRCKEGLGRFQDALADYQKALETGPNDSDLLEAYGLLALRMGSFHEGVMYLKKAKARCSTVNRRLWLMLAKIYQFSGNTGDAIELYTELLEENPEDIDVFSEIQSVSIEGHAQEHFRSALGKLAETYHLQVEDKMAPGDQLPEILAQLGNNRRTPEKP